jgi:hypothetical protein
MQTVHNSATNLEALAPGQPFRFYFRGEGAIGLKAQFTHGESGTVTPGKGNFAQPGEFELHGSRLLFVTKPHGDDRITYRVDLQSGDIGRSTGAAPVEIYSEWSIQDGAETLHEHKPTPPDPSESVVVAVG